MFIKVETNSNWLWIITSLVPTCTLTPAVDTEYGPEIKSIGAHSPARVKTVHCVRIILGLMCVMWTVEQCGVVIPHCLWRGSGWSRLRPSSRSGRWGHRRTAGTSLRPPGACCSARYPSCLPLWDSATACSNPDETPASATWTEKRIETEKDSSSFPSQENWSSNFIQPEQQKLQR